MTRKPPVRRQDRSVFQPHVRLLSGEIQAGVEFGAKIGASVAGGYTFVDHLSWDAYNESADLKPHIRLYFQRFGYLPATCSDWIYFNRDNRAFLKGCHIRAAGKPLGRPAKEIRTEACKAQAVKDMGERNETESTFSTARGSTGK